MLLVVASDCVQYILCVILSLILCLVNKQTIKQVAYDSLYTSNSYAADNAARWSFYTQLPHILNGKIVAQGTAYLKSGFDIFTLLYQSARILNSISNSDAAWAASKGSIGFEYFNRTCKATDDCYSVMGTSNVNTMPGNDFILVELSYISGLWFVSCWKSHGSIMVSWLSLIVVVVVVVVCVRL